MPPSELVYSVVPLATFKRRTRLSVEESQRTERLARIIALSEALWGTPEVARAFLNRPHPLLAGKTPLALAHSELGARRVENLIHHIEQRHPLFAKVTASPPEPVRSHPKLLL